MGGTCGQRVEVDLETFADELHLDDLGARGALGGIGAEKGHHETSKWGRIEGREGLPLVPHHFHDQLDGT